MLEFKQWVEQWWDRQDREMDSPYNKEKPDEPNIDIEDVPTLPGMVTSKPLPDKAERRHYWVQVVQGDIPYTAEVRKRFRDVAYLAIRENRLRKVFALRFGFDGEPQTLDQVREVFGLSREYTRHLQMKAWQIVHQYMGLRRSEMLDDTQLGLRTLSQADRHARRDFHRPTDK